MNSQSDPIDLSITLTTQNDIESSKKVEQCPTTKTTTDHFDNLYKLDYNNLDVRSSLDTSDKSLKSGTEWNENEIDRDLDLNIRMSGNEGQNLTKMLDDAKNDDA